jgi:hypothetical protein
MTNLNTRARDAFRTAMAKIDSYTTWAMNTQPPLRQSRGRISAVEAGRDRAVASRGHRSVVC